MKDYKINVIVKNKPSKDKAKNIVKKLNTYLNEHWNQILTQKK